MPLKKGGRMFKKGLNAKKKMLKSRNEVKIATFIFGVGSGNFATNFFLFFRLQVAVKFITDIIARHGLDFSAKLTQILRIHQANKPQ